MTLPPDMLGGYVGGPGHLTGVEFCRCMSEKGRRGRKAARVDAGDAADLQRVADAFRAVQTDRRNVNSLLELCAVYERSTEAPVLHVAAEAICRTLQMLAEEGLWVSHGARAVFAEEEAGAALCAWLCGVAEAFRGRSLQLLGVPDLAPVGFNALLQCVRVTAREQRAEGAAFVYPAEQVLALVAHLCEHVDPGTPAYELLDEAVNSYRDVRFYAVRALARVAQGCRAQPGADVAQRYRRVFAILSEIAMETDAEVASGAAELTPSFVDGAVLPAALASTAQHLHEFSACWLEVLQGISQHAPALHRPLLAIVNERIMPYLPNPCLLADYLTDSYNAGGLVSLLALHGLFTLMHRHNLDYPAFFAKLYQLLDANILHCRYRRRFCRLFALFMTSTHMPAYLVAAFVKRMARLALDASPAVIPWVLAFVYNAFKAHPAVRVLIHRAHAGTLLDDPFVMAETDPARCRAIDSSLWELQAFSRHYWAEAVRTSALFSERLTKPPFSLDALLDRPGYHQLIQAELAHPWSKIPPLNVALPATLF